MILHRRDHFKGQVLVLMAISMAVMLGFAALAVDVGHLLGARRTAQNAADAAALAGARLLMAGRSDPEIRAAVTDYAARNLTESVRITGSSVEIDRTAKTVRVRLTADVERFFIGAVYTGDWQARAQAVAKVGAEPGDYALLALEQDDERAIDLRGNVTVQIRDGGAMSNGGMSCNGVARLTADRTVDAHMVPGFYYTGPNCRFQGSQGGTGGMPVVEDPLRDMPAPPAPTVPAQVNPAVVNPPYPCDNQAPWVFSAGRYRQNVNCTTHDRDLTFQGGTYRFERAVSYTGNGTVTLNSGFYQFDSGFSVSGNATLVLHPGTYVFRGGRSPLVRTSRCGWTELVPTSSSLSTATTKVPPLSSSRTALRLTRSPSMRAPAPSVRTIRSPGSFPVCTTSTTTRYGSLGTVPSPEKTCCSISRGMPSSTSRGRAPSVSLAPVGHSILGCSPGWWCFRPVPIPTHCR